MKRCPKCSRTYDDDTLRFCLEDGAVLSGATTSRSEPPPTEILYQRTAPTMKVSGPTTPSFPRSGEPSRQSNPLLTVGVIAIAVLLLALVGIAAFFVLRQPGGVQTAQTNSNEAKPGASKKETSPDTNASDTPLTAQPTTDSPLKITATASSVRLAVQANTYFAANAMDNKRSTAWIEGADDGGIGEWIRFDFDREVKLHRILILPGYFKNPEIWRQNNRLAAATVYFSDGTSRDLTFSDRMESQKFDVGVVKTKFVRIVIKQIYPGPDPDTAVSEVAFEWEP
jgi:F5/8 type C domain